MPQVTIDVEVTTTGITRFITATHGDKVIQSTILISEIQTVDDLAAWLLAQRGTNRTIDQSLQKRLTITYHSETVNDPETGQDVDQTVIDSVVSEPLPADDGRSEFQSLPGWASWTANEAEQWITANVTDLASAKTALKAMAKAIIYLRNVAVD